MKWILSIFLLASSALAQSVTCTSTLCTSPLPFSAPSISLTGGSVPFGSVSNLYLWQYAPATGLATFFPFTSSILVTAYIAQIADSLYIRRDERVITVTTPGAIPGSATIAATPCGVQANTGVTPLVFLSCQVLAPGVTTVYAVNLRNQFIPSFPVTVAVY